MFAALFVANLTDFINLLNEPIYKCACNNVNLKTNDWFIFMVPIMLDNISQQLLVFRAILKIIRI